MRGVSRDPELPPPNPAQREGVTGVVREPRAMPSAFLKLTIVILICAAIVFFVVWLTSEPEDRTPLPATPPESLEPADGF